MLSLSHLVGLWQTEFGIIWSVPWRELLYDDGK